MTLKNGEITTETKTQITGAEKQKLFPTDVGMVVTDFLVEHF
jgi:DNA topoisomerase-1